VTLRNSFKIIYNWFSTGTG